MICQFENGVILEDSIVGKPTYKVYIPKLTPQMDSNKLIDNKGKIDKSRILGYSGGVSDTITESNYLEVKNMTDYIVTIESPEEGDFTSKGKIKAKGELAMNMLQGNTIVGTGTGVGANGGGPISTVVTIPPITFNQSASSKKSSLDGTYELNGSAKLNNLHNIEIKKGHKCIVAMISNKDNWRVIHLEDVITGR